jgi:signal transduction histidine kinase/CheY-like chemotaxis protein
MTSYLAREDDRAKAIANFDRALAGEQFALAEAYGSEMRSRRWYEDAYAPIRDDSGAVIGLTVFLSDVSDRVRAERELQDYRERLEQLVAERTAELERASARLLYTQKLESLGLMAGGIAHDFNNLLVGLLGFSDLALETLPHGAPARRYVERIRKTADQAAALTHQLLAYAGRTTVASDQVDLNHVVVDAESLLRVSVPANVSVAYELRRPLPQLVGDAVQLQQVLVNLVTNAAEAIGAEAGHVTVRTRWAQVPADDGSRLFTGEVAPRGRQVVLEVEDDGCGMDEPTRGRLFDPFFTTKFAGRGLGLASVLGIVRAHGGAISVTSRPGEGSLFRVFLPACRGSTDDADSIDDAPSGGSADTVLVIDDEPVVREITAAYLGALGYRAVTAPDGEEGLRLFDEQAPRVRLVIVDLTMPKLSGQRTLELLRERSPDVPVLVISGYVPESERLRFVVESPNSGFLHKPFDGAKLAAALASLDPPDRA